MTDTKHFTDERNVQIVISLLKQHGIKRVIASPGTTNMTFVGSIQNDPFFEIYSCVDERSAAYMACGMAAETGEPIVLSCTGATASRNYMPGLTEAYYRKLPVLAITSHRGDSEIGHLKDQQIDRRNIPNDVAMESVTVPLVKDATDERYCIDEANKAILALTRNGGGPAHINMFTAYSRNFSVQEYKPARSIFRYTVDDKWPALPSGRIAVYVGAHKKFTDREVKAIEAFCATYDAAVFTSHISGYRGNYDINFSLVSGQKQYHSHLLGIDLMIHLGEISGNTYNFSGKETWRVSEDGEIRDTYGSLSKVFQMPMACFFEHYAIEGEKKHEFIDKLKAEYNKVYTLIPELPFGNIWIAQQMAPNLPANAELHVGILNSLRSWSFFQLPKHIYAQCNVGGYGIDGGMSTMIGASLARPEKTFIGVFGDLAFFYDMNSLGNRHVGNNIRIMLINNGRGTEFRNYDHPCYSYGEGADKYMAAAGHFGNQSASLVKHYAEDLGFQYLHASNKQEFLNNVSTFLNSEPSDKPILFEIFTDKQNESDALKTMLNLIVAPKEKLTFKQEIKQTAHKVLGDRIVNATKVLLGKDRMLKSLYVGGVILKIVADALLV